MVELGEKFFVVCFEGCCVVLLVRGWVKQEDSAEEFGDVDLLLKICLLRLWW